MLKFAFALLVFTRFTFATEIFPLDDFNSLGIQARAVKLVDPRFKNLSEPEDQYYLQVQLGQLTNEQFLALKSMYGNLSQVPYDAKKEYVLEDFLPPAIQATVNQVFMMKDYDTSGISGLDIEKFPEDDQGMVWMLNKNGVSSFANCWNTTMQVLRLNQTSSDVYRIYWPSRWEVTETLRANDYSRTVSGQDIRFGDALLVLKKGPFTDTDELQHTAIVISPSLVFEKTDSTNDDPYRISFRQDVEKKYAKIFEGQQIFEFRRYNLGKAQNFDVPDSFKLKEKLAPKTLKVLSKLTPDILDLSLVAGCETGLGGGCDVIHSVLDEAKVITNPKTGRGILKAPQSFLRRFEPLLGK